MPNMSYFSQNIRAQIHLFLSRRVVKYTVPGPKTPTISISFDDFPFSAFDNAKPMLDANNWQATWYVCGSYMNSETNTYGKMYTEDSLLELKDDRHDIGCHSYSHLNFQNCSTSMASRDCARNMKFFFDHGFEKASSFAFPFGASTLLTKRVLLPHYSALRSVDSGINQDDLDLGHLKAIALQDDRGGVSEALDAIETVKEEGGWLILFSHDIAKAHSPWGTSPEEFSRLLSAIEKADISVKPVRDVLHEIQAEAAIDQPDIADDVSSA